LIERPLEDRSQGRGLYSSRRTGPTEDSLSGPKGEDYTAAEGQDQLRTVYQVPGERIIQQQKDRTN